LSCWGLDTSGSTVPPSGTFVQVSVGLSHSCGLATGGALYCWGDDSDGQSTPPGGTYTLVTSGYSHNCALTGGGAVVCWGANNEGQLLANAISLPLVLRNGP